MIRSACAATLTVWFASAGAAPAMAQGVPSATPSEQARTVAGRSPFDRGSRSLGVRAGWGAGRGLDAVCLHPRFAYGLTDPFGPASVRGSLEVALEGNFPIETQPRDGSAYGAELLFAYHWLASEVLVPFVEAGAGILDLDFDAPRQRDGFNFSLHAGAGLQWVQTDRVALTASWRFQHISNAGTRRPNGGLDFHTALIGVRAWFD